MGHKLQLVYGDALLSNPMIKNLNKTIFDIMGQYTCGQASLNFKELAMELKHPTLSNKRNQETRWVRASLTAYQAFFRNIPTFYILLGRESNACTDDEGMQDIYASIEQLVNGKFLALGIGRNQLLDLYAKTSLDAQYMRAFPTTVLGSVVTLCKSPTALKNCWEWETEKLQFIDIGSPKELLTSLKAGKYEPYVSDKAKQRAVASPKVNMSAVDALKDDLAHDWGNVVDCVNGDLEPSFSVGDVNIEQVPIIDFGDDEDNDVKDNLKQICGKLHKALQKRLKPIPITEAAIAAFTGINTWYNASLFSSPSQLLKLEQNVLGITDLIEGPFKEQFCGNDNVKEIVTGYNIFLKLACSTGEGKLNLEETYERFWKLHHQTAEATLFIRFFEFVQGKSFSEAMCESIGSIMNMATSSGRTLHPTNFAKEIFLRFNLPPLHTAMTNIVPDTLSHELFVKKKELIRRADSDPRQLRKLNFSSVSASLGNFRQKEEETFLGISESLFFY